MDALEPIILIRNKTKGMLFYRISSDAFYCFYFAQSLRDIKKQPSRIVLENISKQHL